MTGLTAAQTTRFDPTATLSLLGQNVRSGDKRSFEFECRVSSFAPMTVTLTASFDEGPSHSDFCRLWPGRGHRNMRPNVLALQGEHISQASNVARPHRRLSHAEAFRSS